VKTDLLDDKNIQGGSKSKLLILSNWYEKLANLSVYNLAYGRL